LCDERGEIVDGDQILAVLARRLLRDGRLPGGAVVATVMSNVGLERSLAEAGARLVRVAVGDRHVVERMRQDRIGLGGEQSGHIIVLEHATTGDGIVSALAMLGVMVREQRLLSELAGCMTRFPQVLKNLPVRERRDLSELGEVSALIADIEGRLGDSGRVLVRYSGTELLARVMVEGPDTVEIDAWADEIVAALRKAVG
jgi:phosphoglucosamine mutase